MSTSIGPTISFTLAGDSWSGDEDTPGDGFALFNSEAGREAAISVASYRGEVFSDECHGDVKKQIGANASDFTTFLKGSNGIHTTAEKNATVGGQPAMQVDLTTTEGCSAGTPMLLWALPVHGDFHFDADEKVRVYAIDAGGTTIVIAIEAFPTANYDVLLQKADEVLATMTITP